MSECAKMAEGVCFDPPPVVKLTRLGGGLGLSRSGTAVGCPEFFNFVKSSEPSVEVVKCSMEDGSESVSSEEDNFRKKRCSDRYDSSESSDSGVAVHCGDCGSSNSDITEPCSPLSTTSLEEMPPTQSQATWPWSEGDPPSKKAKQSKLPQFLSSANKFLDGAKTVALSVFQEKSFNAVEQRTSPGCLPSPVHFLDTPPSSREEDTSRSAIDTSSSSSDSTAKDEPVDISSLFQKPTSVKSKEQERTIRFPVKNGWKGHYVSDIVCRWTSCEFKFSTSSALLEHLQTTHVNGQTLGEHYKCRWAGCKVFERPSCSRMWLERHVLSHGGNKPYRCIVDGCGHRFSSQTLLQRHVNNHFTEREQKPESKKGVEQAKLIRRNGKKLRYRRQPFSARTYDYFDASIMEGLQYNLIKVTEKRTLGLFDAAPPDTLVVRSEILGKRIDLEGKTEVLIRWHPNNILNDEWMDPTKVERTRHVKIPSLPSESKDCLIDYLWSGQNLRRPPRCRKQGTAKT